MKVLVLSGRFGMGHEMAANAICEQFRKLDKDTEIVKKDLLEELYPHISKLIFGGFRLWWSIATEYITLFIKCLEK